MPNLTSHKPTLQFKRQSRHIIRQLRQFFLQPLNRLRRKVLICIKAKHPLRLNRQIIKGPIELLGIKPRPLIESRDGPHLDGYLMRTIRKL